MDLLSLGREVSRRSLNSQHFFALVSNVCTHGRRKWEASEYEKALIRPMSDAKVMQQ